ncbi:MAG: NFYB/HAP3 family transcription factor subunit [Candidatus Woesearchaeota archaeon]
MAQKRETIIPKAPVARLVQKAGAKRVSAEAVDFLVGILEEQALDIGRQAVRIAKHSGRKTVNDGDVKLAVRA